MILMADKRVFLLTLSHESWSCEFFFGYIKIITHFYGGIFIDVFMVLKLRFMQYEGTFFMVIKNRGISCC